MPVPPASYRRILWGILALAFLLRLGFLFKNWDNLEFAPSFLLHTEVARNILNGHWFQINQPYLDQYIRACYEQHTLIDPADYPPPQEEHLAQLHNDEGGYGLLLAALWSVTGSERWWIVRLLQIIIDVLMCWLVYRIGTRAFHERAGVAAAFLYAIFLPEIDLAVRPHRDVWVTFLFITTTFVLLTSSDSRRRLVWFALLGMFAGLVSLMRSTAVPFVLFTIVLMIALRPTRQEFLAAAALLFGFLLTFSPLLVRNAIVFGKPMLTRGAFWHSFWGGVGQFPNPYGIRENDREIAALALKLNPQARFDTPLYEETLKKEALRFVEENPSWVISATVKRALTFVFPRIGRELFFQNPHPQEKVGTINRLFGGGMLLVVDGLLAGLYLVGIWLSRRRWRVLLVVLFPYVYTLLTLAPFYLVGRNITNVYFVVLLLATLPGMMFLERALPSLFPKY